MSIHLLLRNGSTEEGTFGELVIQHKKFYTVERPWADNKPFASCIPLGSYKLEDHHSDTRPHTFALVNDQLKITHFKENDCSRYAILIHPANVATDVEGCIGIGYHYGVVYTHWAVMRSKDATAEAVGMMKAGDTLRIIENKQKW